MTSLTMMLMMVLLFTMPMMKNPVKMGLILVVLSTLIMMKMTLSSGSTWFPLLYLLLFMGGVIVMFMILSSLLPNQPMNKSNMAMKTMFFCFLIIYTLKETFNQVYNSIPLNSKIFTTSMSSFTFTITLILIYFMVLSSLILEIESPLRSEACYKKKKFCKFFEKSMAMKITRKQDSMTKIINSSLWDLPSPSTMTYFWNFGSTLGLCLAMQILTGLFLTFHYTSFSEESFSSIVMIMREVWSGWFVRLLHMNGASAFFFFTYLHLFRGMYYFSASHKMVWNSGISIMIILMAISFLGYVLPWGQMSYWAVAVITNLFSVIPIIGTQVVTWLWGGFSVSAPTLTRFYSLHFLLPFILSFMVIIHLVALHKQGSSNSLGLNSNMDKIQFHPYFSIKDLIFIILVLITSLMVSFFFPYALGDAVNNVPANAMQTPVHIQPEWYFLPSYAILRALPSKTAGVLALALSVTIYYLMPLYKLSFSTKFSNFRTMIFWAILASFLFLMKMGALPAEEPYVFLSKAGALLYFSFILMFNM